MLREELGKTISLAPGETWDAAIDGPDGFEAAYILAQGVNCSFAAQSVDGTGDRLATPGWAASDAKCVDGLPIVYHGQYIKVYNNGGAGKSSTLSLDLVRNRT